MAEDVKSFSPGLHFKYIVNSSAKVLLGLSLLLMVNYVASRHYIRLDLTSLQKHSLSPKSIKLVQNLPSSLQIIAVGERSKQASSVYMSQLIEDLVEEFSSQSPQVYSHFWDYHRENQKVEVLSQKLSKHGIHNGQKLLRNALVLQYQQEYKVLSYYKLFESGSGQYPKFRGEQVVSSAIYHLITEKRTRVLFVTGHGERNPDSDRPEGFSLFKSRILQENATVEVGEIQDDLRKRFELLILGSPKQNFREAELKALEQYLDAGGKMMVFADSEGSSNINRVLRTKGVLINEDRIEGQNYPAGSLIIRKWEPPHPITLPFSQFSGYSAYMEGVSSLRVNPEKSETYKTHILAWSDSFSRAVPKTALGDPQPGPLPVAAVSEAGETRLVVFGDSDFLRNGKQDGQFVSLMGLRDGANLDLALNAFNWCLEEESRLSIESKTMDIRPIQLDPERSRQVGFLLCIFIPVMAALCYWLIFGWSQSPTSQNYLEILEDLLRCPKAFFSTSPLSLKESLAFQFRTIILLTFFWTFLIVFFAFPYFTNFSQSETSQIAESMKTLADLENQLYQKIESVFVKEAHPSESTVAPKKLEIRMTLILSLLHYTLLFSLVSLAVVGIHLLLNVLLIGLLILFLRCTESSSGKESEKRNEREQAASIGVLSLFTLQWLLPGVGLYTSYLLYQGLGNSLRIKRSYNLLLVSLLTLLLYLGFFSILQSLC